MTFTATIHVVAPAFGTPGGTGVFADGPQVLGSVLLGLPKLNGYEASRKIHEQPWSKGMVLVALTGWGQEEDWQRSQEAGFDRHLVKPVDLAALEKLLAELGGAKGDAG